uniref:Gustatory receptor n=1 Tax=Anastrepha ludens TaxID=28586 RepID=A0A9E8IIA4_9MUSC|nr:gustatory receptor 21a-2 [Anastrepha ludens]
MAYWAIATRKCESPPMKITPVLNPNQREFLEDELLYREKLEILAEHNTISTDLFVRKFEDIDDPILLDKHDSFYHTTKSLLVLFQIMGVMPIHRNPQKPQMPRTGYSWTSKQVFWAIFVFSVQTTVVVMVLRERVNTFLNDSDRRFDEAIYNVIFISLLFTNFLLPVASWRHGPQVAIFKNMWTNYQLKFLKVTGSPIVFPNLYPLTNRLANSFSKLISAHLGFVFLFVGREYCDQFVTILLTAMLNGFCSLWYINCTAFGTASRALSASLEMTLMSDKPAKKLTEYRHLWVDLSHMMQQLGRAYSNMYGMYCLVVFFTTIIATYGSLSEIMDHGATYKEVGLFVIVFYCMSLLYIICNEAHYATQSVGLDFQTKLLNVDLTVVDSATQKEVEMFLMAITKNPPIMNLDGYANINRELITSNVSFMATYLVVLLQFKITEQRNYTLREG